MNQGRSVNPAEDLFDQIEIALIHHFDFHLTDTRENQMIRHHIEHCLNSQHHTRRLLLLLPIGLLEQSSRHYREVPHLRIERRSSGRDRHE
jgi:predicted component of type VI protein secretion system